MLESLIKKVLYIILVLLISNFYVEDDINKIEKASEPEISVESIAQYEERPSCIDVKADDLKFKIAVKKSNVLKRKNDLQALRNKEINSIDKEILKKIDYEISYDDGVIKENIEKKSFSMGTPEDYSDIKGVACFRGNNFRNSASYGFADISDKKLEIVWNVSIGGIGRWTGVGWNGQPAIIEWPDELRKSMNIFEDVKNKEGLKEVIYATLDSNIYFLDLDDGSFTRDKIKVPGPIKGSVSIDPRGIPLLYAGQGINMVNERRVQMGYRIFNLLDQSLLHFINGSDSFAFRGWSAFDSTSIVDKKTDTMLICGENGILYKVKLNTSYNETEKELSIDPITTKYRYKILGNNYQGIENSIAVYKNLAYFADNGGWLQCIDINTLEPTWIYNVTDDTDSTIVIDEEDNRKVSLYTACEVDKQGPKGNSYIRKLNAISGELIWEKSYSCFSKLGDRPNNGGALATPIVGKKSIENLVIYNLARYGGFNKGLLIALDKKTGNEVWRLELKNYSWSSPVDIYTEEGEGYILLCDSAGRMYLIEGATGKVLDEVLLGSNVEGSPAVFENMVVVGTRGQKIFGIRIK